MMNYFLYRINSNTAPYLLESARFVLGSHMSDDIGCDHSAPSHFTGVFASGLFSILETQAPIWLNGRLVRRLPLDIPQGAVLSLGQDIHFYYGTTDIEVPEVPALEALPDKNALATGGIDFGSIKSILFYLGGIIAAIVFVGILGWATYHDRKAQSEFSPITPEVVKEAIGLESFVKELLGQHLLAYKEMDHTVYVTAFAKSQLVSDSWTADIQPIADKEKKQVKYHWLTETSLLDDVRSYFKGWIVQTTWSDGVMTVSATVAPQRVSELNKVVQMIQRDYPWMQVLADIKPYNAIKMEVMSVSVSARTASAVVRRNGQMVLVLENEPVFDAGRLKLVKHNGIVVATPYGDMFVPLGV